MCSKPLRRLTAKSQADCWVTTKPMSASKSILNLVSLLAKWFNENVVWSHLAPLMEFEKKVSFGNWRTRPLNEFNSLASLGRLGFQRESNIGLSKR